ncbi:MAG: AAA family ATPase [Longimicrobiales bacterium]
MDQPEPPARHVPFRRPTGTGKTEIAKALAEYRFGSVGRMIRTDMSEPQTPESLDRLHRPRPLFPPCPAQSALVLRTRHTNCFPALQRTPFRHGLTRLSIVPQRVPP